MNLLTSSPPTTFDPLSANNRLARMVRVLLGRVYEGGIFKIIELTPDLTGNIEGRAIANDRKFLDVEINFDRNAIVFNESLKRDSYNEGLVDALHLDKRFNAPKCKIGVRCKGSCIEKGDKCRNPLDRVAKPLELKQLRQTALETKGINSLPDDLETRTMRELQKIAQEKSVYRSNHQSKQELIQTLRTLERNPESQERLRKTLEQRRVSRKTLEKSLPGQLAKYWRDFRGITKAAGISPELGAIAATTFLIGASATAYSQMRDRYRSGLSDSANMAYERAQKIPIDSTNKPNVMFAVGGFGSVGSSGEKMKDLLEVPANNTKGEKWFGAANHIIPFTHKENDILQPTASKFNSDGNYNPAYLGAIAQSGFGKFVSNFQKGRNEGAVDLAAQLYAYGNRYKEKGLNILGHGSAPTDEAIEILSRMPKGRDILDRINLVRLGAPDFGFTNDKLWDKFKHRTISSDSDPFSFLPKKAAQWISTVKGHEPENYLNNGEVRERLREAFNYYSSSILGNKDLEARNKEFRGALGEALNVISPGTGALWNQINRVQDMAKRNPLAASILGGAVATGASVATYNKIRKNYQSGLKYSALEAKDLVAVEKEKLRTKHIPHNSATFVVGGIGFAAKDIKGNLPEELQKSHFVEFDGATATSGNAGIEGTNPGSASYNTHVITNGYGTHLNKNLQQSMPVTGSGKVQNVEAVQLAAQLYAMADTKFNRAGGKSRKLDINVIAGGDGGLTAREALQIIKKMPDGDRIANRIRLVTLGTPTFGLAEDSIQEKNIVGADDPVGKLPHQPSPVSTTAAGVRHHSAKDYLQNQQVRDELKAHFQRPKPQPTQAEIQEKERQAKAKEAERKRQETAQQEEAQKNQKEVEKQQALAKKEADEAISTAKRQQKELERLQSYGLGALPPKYQQEFLKTIADDPNWDWNSLTEGQAKKILQFVESKRRKRSQIDKVKKANQGYEPPKPKG